MRLGYNTNGLAHHRLLDALALLADEGYQSIALTLDSGALDPFVEPVALRREIEAVGKALERRRLGCVIETGARYLLNPRKKHDPTLLDPDPDRRAIRIDFLRRSIELAAALRADCVSLWSGILPDPDAVTPQQAMDRLVESLQPVLAHTETRGIRLGFEPEPGMFIDTFERFAELDRRIDHRLFHLTVDIGHVHCIEEGSIADHLRQWGPRIVNVHIEDMVRGVHDHLMFGEGTIVFPPVIESLREIGYEGGLHVELSRHSHMGVEAVRRSAEFLRPLLDSRSSSPPREVRAGT